MDSRLGGRGTARLGALAEARDGVLPPTAIRQIDAMMARNSLLALGFARGSELMLDLSLALSFALRLAFILNG